MTEQIDPRRAIQRGDSTVTSFDVNSTQSLESWLAEQIAQYDLAWLLLHSELGVVWGERRDNALVFSTPGIMLVWDTLQEARLFGKNGELYVWNGPQGWRARYINDLVDISEEWFDQDQLLWGNRAETSVTANTGFVAVAEGSQGIVHLPPIDTSLPVYRDAGQAQSTTDRARLKVRHYMYEDDAGVQRVGYSRLVMFLKPGEK